MSVSAPAPSHFCLFPWPFHFFPITCFPELLQLKTLDMINKLSTSDPQIRPQNRDLAEQSEGNCDFNKMSKLWTWPGFPNPPRSDMALCLDLSTGPRVGGRGWTKHPTQCELLGKGATSVFQSFMTTSALQRTHLNGFLPPHISCSALKRSIYLPRHEMKLFTCCSRTTSKVPRYWIKCKQFAFPPWISKPSSLFLSAVQVIPLEISIYLVPCRFIALNSQNVLRVFPHV